MTVHFITTGDNSRQEQKIMHFKIHRRWKQFEFQMEFFVVELSAHNQSRDGLLHMFHYPTVSLVCVPNLAALGHNLHDVSAINL